MRSLTHSLQFRLMLSFILVIIATVGVVFLFFRQSVINQINAYQEAVNQQQVIRMERELSGYYLRYHM